MTEALNIGITCFPSLGGSGVVASELAMGLARRGHHVHVLASSRPGRLPMGCDHLHFHAIEAPGYPLFPESPYTLAAATRMVDVARQHRVDVMNVHYAVPHAASALLARQVLGRDAPAFVTTLHGTDVTRLGCSDAYRSVTAFAVAASEGISVPSDYLRRAAHDLLGIPRERDIEVIPNFIDTDHFAPPPARDRTRFAGLFDSPEEGPVLIHVSNFRPVKRPLDLVEVLARVRRTVPARLLLVGDGPERAAAEQRAAELALSESTCFLGKRLDFAEYLRHADAFLLTSESESFGVAALEALGSGVPVVAYRVGGLPELVVPGTGLLVEPLNLDALSAAVVEVVEHEDEQAALGHAARAHVLSRFRREPALDAYESYFRRILAREESKPC